MSAEEKAPHPSLVPVALIVNSVRNGRKGTPREIAQEIVAEVFKGEVEQWADCDDIVEGGIQRSGGKITQTSSLGGSTHHRRVLVFYGPWEEGVPPAEQAEQERREAGVVRAADLPPSAFEADKSLSTMNSAETKVYRNELQKLARQSLVEMRQKGLIR